MNQTRENGKKPNFGPDFGPFGPNSGCQIFFPQDLAPSVTRFHGHLWSCTILEKTNDPILRKQTEGQTCWSDFIGHCRTNVERPTSILL